jgi:hypothetical protein
VNRGSRKVEFPFVVSVNGGNGTIPAGTKETARISTALLSMA